MPLVTCTLPNYLILLFHHLPPHLLSSSNSTTILFYPTHVIQRASIQVENNNVINPTSQCHLLISIIFCIFPQPTVVTTLSCLLLRVRKRVEFAKVHLFIPTISILLTCPVSAIRHHSHITIKGLLAVPSFWLATRSSSHPLTASPLSSSKHTVHRHRPASLTLKLLYRFLEKEKLPNSPFFGLNKKPDLLCTTQQFKAIFSL